MVERDREGLIGKIKMFVSDKIGVIIITIFEIFKILHYAGNLNFGNWNYRIHLKNELFSVTGTWNHIMLFCYCCEANIGVYYIQ